MTEDRTPVVIPASPPPKNRKRPIPWDTDRGSDSSDSSMERLIKWVVRGDNYRRWRRGVGSCNEPITKRALVDEFLAELKTADIDYRKTADVQTKMYQLENDFEKSRQWIAANNKPEDGALHDTFTRSVVLQKCKYYYRLESVFGEYIPFLAEPVQKRVVHRTSSKSATPPVTASYEPPPSSSSSSSTLPANMQSLATNRTFQAAFTAFADRLQHTTQPDQQPIDLGTPAPPSIASEPPHNGSHGQSPYIPVTSVPPLRTELYEPEHLQAVRVNEKLALEQLRLDEKFNDARIELKRRKLDILESHAAKKLDIKKRKATAEILAAHARLISELRSLGLQNSEIIDYMKKAEKL